MADTKTYTCEFEIPSGSSELTLEADFELTDEELQQAIDALEKFDYRFNHDLHEAMFDAIWDVAWDQFLEDAKEMALYDDMSDDELLDRDGVFQSIYNITEPEVKA